MAPLAHLLLSWTIADSLKLPARDRNLVTWCGVIPDLDGAGLIVDMANDLLGRPETAYYHLYHHEWLHGLPAALVVSAVLCLFAQRRWLVLLAGVVVFHLHLLADLAGGRGPAPTDLWDIAYLGPVSHHFRLLWRGQWELGGWQNLLILLLLLGFTTFRAIRRGYSPASLLCVNWDRRFVAALREAWQRVARFLVPARRHAIRPAGPARHETAFAQSEAADDVRRH